ncbi:hypothetical protein T03_7207, partial [Trichinella britovi]
LKSLTLSHLLFMSSPTMPGIIRILSITLSKTCNLSTSVSLRFSRKVKACTKFAKLAINTRSQRRDSFCMISWTIFTAADSYSSKQPVISCIFVIFTA